MPNKKIDNTVKTMIISKKIDGQEEEYKRYKERAKAYKAWK